MPIFDSAFFTRQKLKKVGTFILVYSQKNVTTSIVSITLKLKIT